MPVVGHPRHRDESQLDRDVAGDHPAALERLGHDDVVDLARRDPRTLDRGAHRDLGELERVDVDERALAGATDRRTGGGDDDGISHGMSPAPK